MLKKTRGFTLRLVSLFAALNLGFFLLAAPSCALYLGNVFFGGVPSIYNVTTANFFFTFASHPIFGKPAPWAYYQLGRTYFIQGSLDVALENFDAELKYYPNHTKVYYMKGLTLGYLNREKEAIDAFSIYIKSTSDTWASYNDKAWLQFRIGDIDGALATIEPVAKQQPFNPWIANTYGVLLMNKGRYAEAKESLLKGKETLSKMTEEDWGRAYPGNDPRIYKMGLTAMKESFDANLELVNTKIKNINNSPTTKPK